ncbi:MAG: ComEC/Rec2 family competence protein [Ruminococcus sp.]|nr:ComEC/Rec2 family competence protein [Ruminococcus sp.]
MIGAAAAYMSGLFFASFFMDAKGVLMYAAAAVLVVLYGRRKKFAKANWGIVGGALALGVCLNLFYTAAVYGPAQEYGGSTDSYSGVVEDVVRYDGDRVSYTLYGRAGSGRLMRVSYFTSDIGADLGDTVAISECTFAKPESDYLFDAETVCKARHIALNVTRAKDVSVRHKEGFVLSRALRDYRENAVAEFRAEMGDDCGGFLAGMVFGEKRYLDGNTRSALYRTGIGHVLAVSGLHVSIIAALIMALMKALRVNRFVSFAVVNVLIIALIALANYPVSALRAAIMLDIMYSAALFRRQNDPLNSLAAAVLLIGLYDPYCVYSAGFMLSVAGTAGVAVFAPYMTAKMEHDTVRQRLVIALVTAICTTLAVFPLCMYYFDETSLVSPFANIILLPMCTVAMVLGLVHLLTFGLLPVLRIVAGVIKLILLISDGIASVPIFHTSDDTGLLSGLLLMSAAAIIGVFIFRRDRRTLAVMTACAVALFTAVSTVMGTVRRHSFRAAVLGSGSNAAVVVTHGGHADIVDLSGHYRSAEYVRKYLTVNGIVSADTVLLTKNVQAEYSAYEKELGLFRTNRRIVTGDTRIYCGDAQTAGDSMTVSSGGCELTYEDGELTVSYDGREISFVSASEKSGRGGVTVCYGKRTSNSLPERGAVFTDDTTDELTSGSGFEIVVSRGGEYRIRRL